MVSLRTGWEEEPYAEQEAINESGCVTLYPLMTSSTDGLAAASYTWIEALLWFTRSSGYKAIQGDGVKSHTLMFAVRSVTCWQYSTLSDMLAVRSVTLGPRHYEPASR